MPKGKAIKKTSLGLDENLEALLAYVLGFITGIVFWIIEKENNFVKFHAVQSTITFGAVFIIGLILGFIPIIGWILGLILWIIGIIPWILGMVKAYNGEYYKFPVVGDIAEKQVKH